MIRNLAIAVLFLVLCVVLGVLSLDAACAIRQSATWYASDYWLAWFSAFSLVGAALSGLTSAVATAILINDTPRFGTE